MMRFRSHSRSAVWAVVAPLVFGAIGDASAGSVEAGGRIVKVTVFDDRAEVVREAEVRVPAGASTVTFEDLPQSVVPGSFTVSATGVPAVLGAVTIRDEADQPEETDEYRAAKAEVERIQDELARLEGADRVAGELLEFLRSLRAGTAAETSDRLREMTADPATVRQVYEFLQHRLEEMNEASLERKRRRADLQKDLEVAVARQETARPPGRIRRLGVDVEVEASQGGSLAIRLGYVVVGTGWKPAYRAALDAESGEITLEYEAAVLQASGEDWKDVSLVLSTAEPARGVAPARLDTWIVRPFEPRVAAMRDSEEFKRARPAPPRAQGAHERVMAMEPGVADTEATVREAEAVRSAYNVSFRVPGESDVPADGDEHRVTLSRRTLSGELTYRAVPSREESAFLTAKTRAPAEYPLLGGPVRVFVGTAFLGSFPLDTAGPGEELDLPFGRDNRVEVRRVAIPRTRSTQGFIGKDRQELFAYRTTIRNGRDRPVDLILEDRVPVATDERIRVEIRDATTPGYRKVDDRPGILEWPLRIEPRQEVEVVLEFVARYPKEMNVQGL